MTPIGVCRCIYLQGCLKKEKSLPVTSDRSITVWGRVFTHVWEENTWKFCGAIRNRECVLHISRDEKNFVKKKLFVVGKGPERDWRRRRSFSILNRISTRWLLLFAGVGVGPRNNFFNFQWLHLTVVIGGPYAAAQNPPPSKNPLLDQC